MHEVPDVISTNDLIYLEDILIHNLITIKKINIYLLNVTHSEVKELLSSLLEKYRKHYHLLLECLGDKLE